ncbi:hypothetical protein LCGC14_2500570, partial [marine sediment metagenome]
MFFIKNILNRTLIIKFISNRNYLLNYTLNVNDSAVKLVELIQISDLHYGSEFEPEYMENIISYIKQVRPDVVICTGDIVHKGRIKQFEGILPYIKRIKEI